MSCTYRAFIKAISRNEIQDVDKILSCPCSVNVNYAEEYDFSATWYAGRYSNYQILNMVLERGGDPTQALIGAIESDRIENARLALKYGANPNARMASVICVASLLTMSAIRNRGSIVSLLLENGADAFETLESQEYKLHAKNSSWCIKLIEHATSGGFATKSAKG